MTELTTAGWTHGAGGMGRKRARSGENKWDWCLTLLEWWLWAWYSEGSVTSLTCQSRLSLRPVARSLSARWDPLTAVLSTLNWRQVLRCCSQLLPTQISRRRLVQLDVVAWSEWCHVIYTSSHSSGVVTKTTVPRDVGSCDQSGSRGHVKSVHVSRKMRLNTVQSGCSSSSGSRGSGSK